MLESRESRPHSTSLYKAACEEILKVGHMIPDTILNDYKKRDMNEVRVAYVQNPHLEIKTYP